MTETQKRIQSDIERHVVHLARTHGVVQDAIWREMYMRSAEEVNLRK